jgi:hypothetical protein
MLLLDAKIKQVELFAAFQRGMLYIAAYNRFAAATVNSQMKKWFPENLGISYDAAARYYSVALLLRRCPRLFMCDLSFDQLAKHGSSIKERLKTDNDLYEKLAVTVEFRVLGQIMKITHADVITPSIAYKNMDPDDHYYMLESANNEAPLTCEEKAFHSQMSDPKHIHTLFPDTFEVGAVGGLPIEDPLRCLNLTQTLFPFSRLEVGGRPLALPPLQRPGRKEKETIL